MVQWKGMKASFLFLPFLSGLLVPSLVFGAMSSGHYQINWDDLSAGGGEQATSSNYGMSDTIGGTAIGSSASERYQVKAGYRVGQDDLLALHVYMHGSSAGVAYTALNTTEKTVTVTSASDFLVGDLVAIVENVGFAQKTLVGKVVSIGGSVLTLDAMSGSVGMSGSPTGGNDFVYLLDGSSASFGTLAAGAEQVMTGALGVQSTVGTGYTVYVQTDQPLQSVSHTMTAVADGAVSTGSEEYGYTATGTRSVLTEDVPLTTAQTAVQSSAGPSSALDDRVGVMYKLSVTASTPAGSYAQSVFYTLTANF